MKLYTADHRMGSDMCVFSSFLFTAFITTVFYSFDTSFALYFLRAYIFKPEEPRSRVKRMKTNGVQRPRYMQETDVSRFFFSVFI